MTVTSRNDQPVVFDAAGEDLVGTLTHPDGKPNGLAAITLYGTGPFPVFGRNQVGVSVAHDLAARGFHVLRFDYRGAGESGGEMRPADLGAPWTDDVLGAVRFLEGLGHKRIVLICVCFGARNGLAASGQIKGLAGMLMISPPVGQANHTETILQRDMRWYLTRALSLRRLRGLVQGAKAKRRRALVAARLRRAIRPSRDRAGVNVGDRAGLSPQFYEPMRALVERDVPLRIVYGRKDDFFAEFERAMAGPLGDLVERGQHVSVEILDGHGSNVASLEAQQAMRAVVSQWAVTLVPTAAGDRT